MDLVYHLWDYLIIENDPLFLHYFFIAFLSHHRAPILKTEVSILPQTLCNLKVHTPETLSLLFTQALTIRDSTPYSFSNWILQLGIWDKTTNKNQMNSTLLTLEQYQCLPIFPDEVLFFSLDSKGVSCPNTNCRNYAYWTNILSHKINSSGAPLSHVQNKNSVIGTIGWERSSKYFSHNPYPSYGGSYRKLTTETTPALTGTGFHSKGSSPARYTESTPSNARSPSTSATQKGDRKPNTISTSDLDQCWYCRRREIMLKFNEEHKIKMIEEEPTVILDIRDRAIQELGYLHKSILINLYVLKIVIQFKT